MAIRKESETRPQITQITPAAAIPGGELQIRGKGLVKSNRPHVTIGEVSAPVVIGSESFVIVRVPEGATDGELAIGNGSGGTPAEWTCQIGVQIADSLHPVANPAVDARGNIFASFSGSRGQKTPVSVYRIDSSYNAQPFVADIMNATGLAFDREGMLYVSSRYDGVIYQVTPSGNMSVYAEGMGVATGLAFDEEGNLYVGDRSGTIFKISRSRQIYVFATLEPSIAAYHLAFGPEGYLYVSGPTTSSFDSIHRVSNAGDVELFYRGVGRPQGIAFDAQDRMYVCASYGGQRGVIRMGQDREPELFLSGHGIVGLAFT
ncbi:MAG: IPT/TIG domain-containing protein, partial [Bryobacteraceae bacterium]